MSTSHNNFGCPFKTSKNVYFAQYLIIFFLVHWEEVTATKPNQTKAFGWDKRAAELTVFFCMVQLQVEGNSVV